ncbi:Uncharacterised protein g4794 [Pycnogonum litorale]
MSKRKLITKNIEQKYEILLEVERGLKSKLQIAKENGIPPNTLSTWIKNSVIIKSAYTQHKFLPHCKRMRLAKEETLEQVLLMWFNVARDKSFPVSGPILQHKADEMATKLKIHFKCSNGWLERFKKRHGIVFRSPCAVIDRKKTVLGTPLREYAPEDIYNADEIGLFFRLLPDKSFS